ncbi:vasoactive intestinal polypeptide receptor 1-like [Lytechinus pictus]|uniref:vasoactive intestinal polypeptide receptor 1-like n=1 Tax=Lytechinus pictus TaxID=7653 RepID=UPI00240E1242|nr:vasoactive intestinal polypeptide receptor 1-like [Lytechinus pictus]
MCWPDTLANTVHKQACPSYLTDTTTRDDMMASKRCEADGTWYLSENNDTWTNYTMCKAEDKDNSIDEKIYQSLQIVYSIGYSLSLVSLVIAMGIFLYFRKLRCTRNMIHMHLFMSFILRAIFVFIRDIIQAQNEAALLKAELQDSEIGDAENSTLSQPNYQNPGCKVAFTLIQYFLVANFYWLLVEGVYLHSLITLAVFSEKSIYRYIALGWGCPAFVVVPWAIVRSFKESSGCWWNDVTRDSSYWIIKAPVMISVIVNFVLFLHILCVLATKLRASNAAEARTYSKLAKSTLILIPLFGVYYIITVGMHASNDTTMVYIRMYFELILSPFQGFLLAILYCFMNGEVKNEIKRKWRLHLLNRTLSTHRTLRSCQSRSSCSTPPRKDSMKNHSVFETSIGRSTFGERFIALKKQFSRGDSSNGHVGNGSLGNSIVIPDPSEPRPNPDGAADRSNLYDHHPPDFDEHENDVEVNEKTKIDIKIEEASDDTPNSDHDERVDMENETEEKSDVFEDDEEECDMTCSDGHTKHGVSDGESRQTFSNIETEV